MYEKYTGSLTIRKTQPQNSWSKADGSGVQGQPELHETLPTTTPTHTKKEKEEEEK